MHWLYLTFLFIGVCSTNLNEIFCQRGEPIDTCIRRHSNGHITNAFQLEITDQAKDGSVLERPFDSSKFLIRPPDDAVNSGFPIPDRQQGVGQYVQWSSRPLPYHQSFYHSNDKWLTSASSGPFQRGDEVSDRPGEQTFGNVVDYKDIPSNERLELSIQVPQVQLSGGLQPFHRLTSNPIPPFARPIWNVLHNKPKPGFLSGLSKPMQGIATNHSTDKIYIHAKDVVIDTGPKIFITSSKPFGNTLNTLENLMSQPTMFPTTLFSKPSSWNNMLPKLLSNALGTKSLIEALKTKPLITNANIGAVGKLLNLLLKTQRIDREPENHTPSISTISDNTKSPATLWTPATDVKHGAAYPLHLQTPVTTKNFDSSKAGYSGQNVVGMINEFHPLLNIYDEYISAHQNQTDTVDPLITKIDSNNVTLSHQPIISNLSISTETLNTEAQKTTNKSTTGNSSAALQNVTNMEMTEQKTTLYSYNQDDAKPINETSHTGQR